MTTYIYALVDPRDDRVRYVGKSIDPENRLLRHMRSAEKNRNPYFKGWIRQLVAVGLRPRIRRILGVPAHQTADEWERHWIAAFRWAGEKLTNIHDGGTGWGEGMPRSTETRAKISAALKGHVVTVATRAKISSTQKGRPSQHKGKPLSAEHRAKLSAALMGHPVTAETRTKLSIRNKGNYKHTSEARAKISAAVRAWRRTKKEG